MLIKSHIICFIESLKKWNENKLKEYTQNVFILLWEILRNNLSLSEISTLISSYLKWYCKVSVDKKLLGHQIINLKIKLKNVSNKSCNTIFKWNSV